MQIERIGEVSVWWIPRPMGARLSPRFAVLVVLLVVPPLAATLWWVSARGEALWAWSTVVPFEPSGPQLLLRYLLLLGVALALGVAVSAPAWGRLARTARRDLAQAEGAARAGRWEEAALRLHRYGLLRGERGRAAAPAAGALDQLCRPHLPTQRRLHVYYGADPPPVPEMPAAGFEPRIVPQSVAGGWWTGAIVALLAVGALAELRDAWVSRHWQDLLNVNFVLAAVLLAGYAGAYVLGFLGRRSYLRFAPGVVERLQFAVRTDRTRVAAIAVRDCDAFLDVTHRTAAFDLVERATGRRLMSCCLARNPDTVEACLRTILSEAAQRPLPERELTG